MTRTEIQSKIRTIREELENRHKYGTVKLANSDGTPLDTKKLQDELYKLTYKLSKLD